MKARVQKLMQRYLQGEREGFSLVELIIVIAIMAILIAVVALAVIPYINSAREAKDHDAINNLQAAFKTVMAKEKFAKKLSSGNMTATKTLDADMLKALEELTDKKVADVKTALSSDAATAAGVDIYFEVKDKECIVFLSKNGSAAVTDSDGEKFQAGGTSAS